MSRRVLVLLCGLILFAGVGLLLTYVIKARGVADDVRCKNNLREITQFAAHFAAPQPKETRKFLDQIPAGTVVLPGIVPEDRLSWLVPVLPGLDQKRQDMATLV